MLVAKVFEKNAKEYVQAQKAVKKVENTDVLVGIPQEEASRDEGGIDNVSLLYIHTNGSPAKGIPARPVIEPAIEKEKDYIAEMLGNALDAALSGNEGAAMRILNKIGMEGKNFARAWFTNPANNWPPNAEITVKGGVLWENVRTGKKLVIKGKRSSRPLIDTGSLRKSITYVVKPKE
jgi:hypothetical protein